MTQPRFSFVPVMDHMLHVTEWGDPKNPAIVMWHGLARTGRDFDELAAALSDKYFVLCPDTIGRGLSSWATNPEAEYSIEYFTGLASDMLEHYGIEQCAWIGTSMGGLIGMRMASGPLRDRISQLVINDIGPEIPQEAIDRILTYAGKLPHFEDIQEAETWLRQVYTPFGPADDQFWKRMAHSSVRRMESGKLTIHYDPRIIVMFSASREEMTTWDRYEKIRVPTTVIWGRTSDILTEEITGKMAALGPKAKVLAIEDCGHAPTLSRPDDIALLRGILEEQAEQYSLA
ncbi:alpha/beta hydrolase [Rhodobacteraceae bacterium RKSG542]|uniref:alpha/beta fold hydrolase n=1 Tax=Pseudovibrio flavus TaxID=2529854 RepID=UPI0012BB5D2E|nr:alpha/beta hydrolase [Pseudovibrio flavus]MTI17510.1 alpha/beta hydrolase [Pseudovibrio flavus]